MSANPNRDKDQMNRFVCRTIIVLPSLQEMASCRVTLAIWESYISRLKYHHHVSNRNYRYKFGKSLYVFESYKEDTDKLVEGLKTPPRIETLLKASLSKVRSEMKCCYDHFGSISHRIVYTDDIDFNSDWYVWFPNGRIDYRRTAQKIVSAKDGRFRESLNLAIMYDCGLEDEARTLYENWSPSRYYPYDAAHWWEAYLRNEPKMPEYVVKCGELGDKIVSWPFAGIVSLCEFDRSSAIRIGRVWHKLTDDDQVLVVYNMIVNRSTVYYNKWVVVEPLIGSMSWQQQRTLLSMPNAALVIVQYSWRYSTNSQCTVWAWMYCRDFINVDDFDEIFKRAWGGERDSQWVLSLEKIWDNASDHLKHYILLQENGKSRFFNSFFVGNLSPAAYKLFVKYVAAMKSPEQRVSFTLEHSVRLATSTYNPDNLKRIFDELLPNPNNQREFKTSVMKSQEMVDLCADAWRKGYFEVLKANMKFYFDQDVNSAREYLQKVSNSIISDPWNNGGAHCVIIDAHKWNECSQFIDEIFPLDPVKALETKKQFISSFLLRNANRHYDYFTRGKSFFHHSEIILNKVFNMIESVYQDREEIKPIKTEFIKNWPSRWEFKCYDVYFHKVIEWCCDDNDEAITMCKEKLESQDYIFDTVFFQLNKTYVTEAKGLKESLLGRLDKYLSWFLVDEQRVNEYKVRRLNKSDGLSIFSAIRRRKDESSFRSLLGWFFNGDDAKIREFQSKKMKY